MEAVKNGAVVIVAGKATQIPSIPIPVVYVDDVREAMSHAAKRFYHNVCERLTIIGVTGTNGKTTCTHILRDLLADKHPIGVIGTLGSFIGDECLSKGLTTPDPIDLHETFYKMYNSGVTTVIMEVSAHAIHYKKIAGVEFKSVIFTNLTQDHLDFFPSMDAYANTKYNFLLSESVRTAITNVDDPWGRKVLDNKRDVYKYSISDAKDLKITPRGSEFTIEGHKMFLPLHGRFNVYNALGCIWTAHALGLKWGRIRKRLKHVKPVPGRFNVIRKGKAAIVIDYAHTPDGLEKILTSARELSSNNLYLVFGCGGDRDKTKREIMGAVAARHADFTFITSDNSRSESPDAIIMQIEAGFTGPAAYYIEPDRRVATHLALSRLKRGDVLVVAGKGAETTQEVQGELKPYSDAEVVANYFKHSRICRMPERRKTKTLK